MNNPTFRMASNAGGHPYGPLIRREGREKNRSAKNHLNPLRSLVYSEGIQGNPRRSKAPKRGIPSKIATDQENPNGLRSPIGAGAA
jgi:hypothetical protein